MYLAGLISLKSAALSLVVAHASVTAPVQVLTIHNYAGVPSARIASLEQALTDQANEVRQYWGTPAVRFGAGGWSINLVQAAPGVSDWHSTDINQVPDAQIVATGAGWQPDVSHEMVEMLADPYVQYPNMEICDPVEATADDYWLAGVQVSDFLLPDGSDYARSLTEF